MNNSEQGTANPSKKGQLNYPFLGSRLLTILGRFASAIRLSRLRGDHTLHAGKRFHLDLPDTLGRNAELFGKVVQSR